MRSRISRLLISCCILGALVSAAPPVIAVVGGGEPTTLEAALERIQPDKIRADLEFIASDELEGRDTPSRGQRLAAMFICNRLKRLGFEPGAQDGFYYKYAMQQMQPDLKGCSAFFKKGSETLPLQVSSDYYFRASRACDATFSGEVAFGGSGERGELENADAKDKWLVCFHSFRNFRNRDQSAQQAGARGLIVIADPAIPPDENVFDGIRAMSMSGGLSWPSKDKKDLPFPTVTLSSDASKRFLTFLGVTDPLTWKPKLGDSLGVEFEETRKALDPDGRIELQNVCGFWRGSDPELMKDVIIVSAHYDHVGVRSDGDVMNGADDNGSGTTGLLALAEALKSFGPLKRSVLLLWVSGEEKGLFGSKAWCEQPWLPEGCRPYADINIDMIGRNAPEKLLITPTKALKEYNFITQLAEKLSPSEGFPELGSADGYWTRSDHYNFTKLNIPVVFLFSDVHEDYHQPTDTVEKIDCDKIRRVVRLVTRLLVSLSDTAA